MCADVAEALRKQANDLFRQGRYRDALSFYKQALDEVGNALSDEQRRLLWSNVSACHLQLGNYRSCLRVIAQGVLALTPGVENAPPSDETTKKALFRSARALVKLERFDDARDALERLAACEKDLGQEDQDSGRAVRDEIARIEGAKVKSAKAKEELATKQRLQDEGVLQAFDRLGAVLPNELRKKKGQSGGMFKDVCPSEVEPPHLERAEGSIEDELVMPAFFLSPLANPPRRDLCAALAESATFGDALEVLQLDSASLAVHAHTARGKVLRLGAKTTLKAAFTAAAKQQDDGLPLAEGWALELTLLPKQSKEADAWVANWKSQLAARHSHASIL